ncbi:MAG: pyrroline-5-carboxylate reductase [Clostridiales Family XIII bacterium]|jgi:pyrroline-5-carboxylate reductase|nr:pyrroline-5-carboxylate reductase [Clostridiales Family XIII bacterium]
MILGVVGAGNMGGAIIRGYAKAAAEPVYFHEHFEEKARQIERETGAIPTDSLADMVSCADIILIALKPNMFDDFMPELAAALKNNAGGADKIVVSIAAGISISYLEAALRTNAKILRAMPNTPAMVGAGMTALAASEAVTDDDFAAVKSVFESFGKAARTGENLMDAVTGVSGSSPAYAYMYMQALAECGARHGLDAGSARLFAAQATLGAAEMVLANTDVSIEQLRVNVCSPGGTTIEAVHVLEDEGFIETVGKAMDAAIAKSKTMTK